MVPTARLELAQLSPLPPQDSVSTNFTTSANFCQKSHAFLESRTFYHAIGASRQFMLHRRTPTLPGMPSPVLTSAPAALPPGQQALTSRAAPGINLSCRPAILASPCAHRGPSPGEFPPGYSYEREFVGAHARPAYDASHTQQGLRPVERLHHATSDIPDPDPPPHAARRPAQLTPLRCRRVPAGLPRSAPAARIRRAHPRRLGAPHAARRLSALQAIPSALPGGTP